MLGEKNISGAGQMGMGTQNEVLKRMVKVGLIEKVKFKWRPGGGTGVRRAFQAEVTATAKTLGWACAGQLRNSEEAK